MALNLALCSLFFAFLPWAFASYLSGNNATGQNIGAGGGERSAGVLLCCACHRHPGSPQQSHGHLPPSTTLLLQAPRCTRCLMCWLSCTPRRRCRCRRWRCCAPMNSSPSTAHPRPTRTREWPVWSREHRSAYCLHFTHTPAGAARGPCCLQAHAAGPAAPVQDAAVEGDAVPAEGTLGAGGVKGGRAGTPLPATVGPLGAGGVKGGRAGTPLPATVDRT